MKSTVIHLSIGDNARVKVEVGDKVNPHTLLFENISDQKIHVISASEILKIKPQKIPQLLKKKIGEKVLAGEILIGKKSFFSTSFIKSPKDGILKEIDLKIGTLTIVGLEVENRSEKVNLPVSGKVKHISKTSIDIEIDGIAYQGENGKGDDQSGRLEHITGEDIGILDIREISVNNSIIICKSIGEDAMVKLEVLGVRGLILEKALNTTQIPWVQVREESFRRLLTHVSQNVWLCPMAKQIFILD